MNASTLDAIRDAIRDAPDDPVNWCVYADALDDNDDPRGELISLLVRCSTLGREEMRRLKYLRGTVSLMSADVQKKVEAIARRWAGGRKGGDVQEILDILHEEAHPLLMSWGNGTIPERRLIVVRNRGGGDRWTWAGNSGQTGGGAYPDRAEAILGALSRMTPYALETLTWIEIR